MDKDAVPGEGRMDGCPGEGMRTMTGLEVESHSQLQNEHKAPDPANCSHQL